MKKIKGIIAIILTGLTMFVYYPGAPYSNNVSAQNIPEESSLYLSHINQENNELENEALCDCTQHENDIHSCETLCNHGLTGKGVKIAVFDSGISDVDTAGSISFVEDKEILSIHGNTIAHSLKDMIPDAELYDVRILNNKNVGTYSNLAKGVDWAVENDMDIISLGTVGYEPSEILENAVKKAEENNILVIAAAGNKSSDKPSYPAAYPTVISVGALNEDSEIAEYSNYGDFVDVFEYASFEGTSYSTQKVVATAAQKMESDPGISVKEIRMQITNGKIKKEVKVTGSGDGILHAAATCYHTFNGVYTITKEPTCTTDGTKVGYCTRCGEAVSTVAIPKLGHSYGSWTTTKAATCTTAGTQKRTCSRCYTSQTQTISATGHAFNGSYTITKEATCTTDGTKVGYCIRCGAVVSTVTIPKLGHSYGSWTTTKAATCTTEGALKRTCSRCYTSETQTISATGHTFNGSYTITKEPTCTTNGIKVGYCTWCGAVISIVEISPYGHSYGSWTTMQAETCTTPGTQMRTCSRCYTSQTQTISATGHAFNGIYTTTKEPTCTTPGIKVGYCIRCGGIVSTVEVPATGHSYGPWGTIKAAACTQTGVEKRTCSRCLYSETQIVPATGHAFNGSYTITKEPTCTEEGIKEGSCIYCSAVVSTVSIPPLSTIGHTFNGVYTITKEPTCTEKGTKAGNCTKCGAVVSTVEIPPLDHSYGPWGTIKAETCTQTGVEKRTCSRCLYSETQIAPPTGHTFNGIYTTIKEPTCTEKGTKAGNCIRCGDVVSTVEINELGHSYDPWGKFKAETCTETGVEKRTCSRCLYSETQIIPPTGHAFNGLYTTIKEPTCINEGLKEGRCSRCNEVVSTVSIPPIGGGHIFDNTYKVIKEPTCTEEGTKEGRCKKCNEVISTVSIPPRHKFYGSYLTMTPSSETINEFNSCGRAVKVTAKCLSCGTVDVTSLATFTSTNSSVATVKDGYLSSGTKEGTATITAEYSGMKAVCNVKVKMPEYTKIRALNVIPGSETINDYSKLGSKLKVVAIYDSGPFEVTSDAVLTSGNSDIAYVYQGYIMSGLKSGSTLITAAYEGLTATCEVKVDLNAKVEEKTLRIGNTTSLTIPEDLPVIGGTELNLGLNFIPSVVSIEKDEFKIAVGVDNSKTVGENWNEFKKDLEGAKENSNSCRDLRSCMKASGAISGSFSVSKDWKPSCDVYGYIEGIIVNGTAIVNKGALVMMIDEKYSNQKQFLIGPIPVYFEIGGGVKLESISRIISYVPASDELKLDSVLKITPSFELGGGVGIPKVLSIGGTGKAELEFLIRGWDNYSKVSLTGSLNLKATALFFSAEKTIAKGTWNLYETPSRKALRESPLGDNFNIYNADEYQIMPRDYINKPSSWMGNKQMLRTMGAANTADFTNKELKVLGTNIYPDAQPQLVNYGDGQVLVWVADNPNRTSSNRTMLVYSVYDKATNVWSTPAAVDDDGTADFYPQLAQDGSNLYVVWQNSNKTFTDDVTLELVANSGEIAVSKFDAKTNTFGAAVQLTENNVVDTLPKIAASNNKAYIAWMSNNGSDIFGVKGRNSIYYSELTDNGWSNPTVLCEGLNAVPSLSAGFIENSFTAAYVLDGDNVLETVNDRELYIVRPNSTSTRLTNNDTLDSAPVFSSFNGTDALYWYNEGNISYLTQLNAVPGRVFGESKPGFKDDFRVLTGSQGEMAIIWPNTVDGSTEIYATIYDAAKAEWSEVVKISDIGSKIQSPDGVFDNNGNFNIVFNKFTQLENENEQADLCIMKVIPSYSLSINGVRFDHSKVIPGTELPVDVEITNNGEIGVDGLVIDILDGDEVINSVKIQASIKPGETKTITASMNLPESITKKTYSAKVSTAEGDEYDKSDNVKQFVIGYTDISIQLERYSEGNIEHITANILNLSHVPSGAVLSVTKGSENGEVIDTKTIDSVAGIVKYEYQFDKNAICAGKDSEILYFTIKADQEELYTSDNSEFIVLNTDKTKPVITVSQENRDWSNTAAVVTPSIVDEGGSGPLSVSYAWSKDETCNWSDYSSGDIVQKEEGIWFLYIKAVDNSGNETVEKFGPYNIDNTPPEITCNFNNEYKLGDTLKLEYIVEDTISGVKNSIITFNGKAYVNGDIIKLDTAGVNTIKITAEDAAGNVYEVIKEIHALQIVDSIPPVLTVPADITKEATAISTRVDLGQATATDNLTETKDIIITNDAPKEGFPVGTTTITWTATDTNNNISTAAQKITVIDTTPPNITVPADRTIKAAGKYTIIALEPAKAVDLVDGEVSVTNDAPESFPIGETIVKYTAKDSHNNTATKIIKVTVLKPRGCIDVPSDNQILNGSINVSGWLLDPSGVSKIEVLIDNMVKGEAVYGRLRPDVKKVYPEYNTENCGYYFKLNTKELNQGSHTLTIIETGIDGKQTTLPVRKFNVSWALQPKGCIDTPSGDQTVSGSINVSGWFLDPSGVSKIEVLVDNMVKGEAVYGSLRPDVKNVYSEYNNENCGYYFKLNTKELTEGNHTITIIETGIDGKQTTLPVRKFNVSWVLQPKGYIDTPSGDQTVSGSINISGWFLDSSAVSKIEVLVDNMVKGEAVYGGSRPDVKKVYPEYSNENCGYYFKLNTKELTEGNHTITIIETGADGKQTKLSPRTILITYTPKGT